MSTQRDLGDSYQQHPTGDVHASKYIAPGDSLSRQLSSGAAAALNRDGMQHSVEYTSQTADFDSQEHGRANNPEAAQVVPQSVHPGELAAVIHDHADLAELTVLLDSYTHNSNQIAAVHYYCGNDLSTVAGAAAAFDAAFSETGDVVQAVQLILQHLNTCAGSQDDWMCAAITVVNHLAEKLLGGPDKVFAASAGAGDLGALKAKKKNADRRLYEARKLWGLVNSDFALLYNHPYFGGTTEMKVDPLQPRRRGLNQNETAALASFLTSAKEKGWDWKWVIGAINKVLMQRFEADYTNAYAMKSFHPTAHDFRKVNARFGKTCTSLSPAELTVTDEDIQILVEKLQEHSDRRQQAGNRSAKADLYYLALDFMGTIRWCRRQEYMDGAVDRWAAEDLTGFEIPPLVTRFERLPTTTPEPTSHKRTRSPIETDIRILKTAEALLADRQSPEGVKTQVLRLIESNRKRPKPLSPPLAQQKPTSPTLAQPKPGDLAASQLRSQDLTGEAGLSRRLSESSSVASEDDEDFGDEIEARSLSFGGTYEGASRSDGAGSTTSELSDVPESILGEDNVPLHPPPEEIPPCAGDTHSWPLPSLMETQTDPCYHKYNTRCGCMPEKPQTGGERGIKYSSTFRAKVDRLLNDQKLGPSWSRIGNSIRSLSPEIRAMARAELRPCQSHLKRALPLFGIQCRAASFLDGAEILRWLQDVLEASKEGDLSSWLLSGRRNPQIGLMSASLLPPSVLDLGLLNRAVPYSYEDFTFELSARRATDILQSNFAQSKARFDEHGFVTMAMMGWLREVAEDIVNEIRYMSRQYDPPPGLEHASDLWNSMYSLSSQLVRADLENYLTAVCLGSGLSHRVVAYPMPVQFVQESQQETGHLQIPHSARHIQAVGWDSLIDSVTYIHLPPEPTISAKRLRNREVGQPLRRKSKLGALSHSAIDAFVPGLLLPQLQEFYRRVPNAGDDRMNFTESMYRYMQENVGSMRIIRGDSIGNVSFIAPSMLRGTPSLEPGASLVRLLARYIPIADGRGVMNVSVSEFSQAITMQSNPPLLPSGEPWEYLPSSRSGSLVPRSFLDKELNPLVRAILQGGPWHHPVVVGELKKLFSADPAVRDRLICETRSQNLRIFRELLREAQDIWSSAGSVVPPGLRTRDDKVQDIGSGPQFERTTTRLEYEFVHQYENVRSTDKDTAGGSTTSLPLHSLDFDFVDLRARPSALQSDDRSPGLSKCMSTLPDFEGGSLVRVRAANPI